MFIRHSKFGWIRKITPLFLTVLVVAAVVWGASMTGEQSLEQARRMTEESIRRAAVQCYALEGFYPVNIQYLMDHYGILPDHSIDRPERNKFVIHYQFVADNLLPDILVIPVER